MRLGEDLKPTTLNWRIYHLVQGAVLERIGKGVFRIGATVGYAPGLDKVVKSVDKHIANEFPFIQKCLWNTGILNAFSQHQSNKNYYLVEVEKDSMDAVFYMLKGYFGDVYLNPSKEILENYVLDANGPLIVKPLISEAPTQKKDGIDTVTLEKLLVDLYCDKDIFSFYQGREQRIIFENVFQRYTVNRSRLSRYASRRGLGSEFKKYVNQIIGN